MHMKQTEMKVRGRDGLSVHNVVLEIRGEDARADALVIHGPYGGCSYELPWKDVLDAGMEFVRKAAEE